MFCYPHVAFIAISGPGAFGVQYNAAFELKAVKMMAYTHEP